MPSDLSMKVSRRAGWLGRRNLARSSYLCRSEKLKTRNTYMSTYIVNPVVVRMEESSKGSIYKSIVAMGQRSRQVNDQIKVQISERLADVIDDSEEADGPNADQIAISKEFDRLAKPTFIAMREMIEGKVHVDMEQSDEG